MVVALRRLTKIGVIGGNYAGIGFVDSILDEADLNKYNIKVKVFDKRQGFCHLMGITRALVDQDYCNSIWRNHTELKWYNNPNVQFKYDTVTRVTKNTIETKSGESEEFDFIVVATGYDRGAPVWPESSTKETYLKEFSGYRTKIESSSSVVVVGAGAVGVELAADIKSHYPEKKVTLVHSRALPIVGPFSDKFRNRVIEELKTVGVETLFENRVLAESKREENGKEVYHLKTNQGVELTADLVFNCIGPGKPVTNILDLESTEEFPLLDKYNLVKVRPTMQLANPKYSHIFAIGDINDWQEIKLAGAAMYQGYYAAQNIVKILDNESDECEEKKVLENYPNYPPSLILFMGEKHGVGELESGIMETEAVIKLSGGDMRLKDCTESSFI
ncbi:FAD/NAD(P)-binding domain-containing protein [Conidiobolus coronatus NRRL 28638]|uniref:FAD/NAD(P)-binding domain-containing protein n=1 Tax=Conidiobolus coronatus (strain ATCC 28846 / CBS 209.66 / NRRL 28638) TaxID=796925 RepID=A0A137NPA0_CONC2|nr:FAD/NAD(P)-binding domain-containing protein [Conidiobolus coronatus NRRL 28638]|eukprot:KXN64566.1 FAD/NAD(P)-binding domain-containing protein [Conidiobolus coronatus NRRL 28638]